MLGGSVWGEKMGEVVVGVDIGRRGGSNIGAFRFGSYGSGEGVRVVCDMNDDAMEYIKCMNAM